MIASEIASTRKEKYAYDITIDNSIINALKNTRRLSSGQLKTEIENRIRRKISPYTFSAHLSNLINQRVLQKEDLGRGNNVFYLLTDIAGKKFELGLLGTDKLRIELFRRIYNVIFIYHAFYYYPKIVFSDIEFREFLIKVKAREDELNWYLTGHGHNYDSVDIAYGRIMDSIHMKNIPLEEYRRKCREYWKERAGKTTVLSSIQLTCYPLKDNLDSYYIDRFEHWEINKKSRNRRLLTEYHLHICGFSVNDIMEASGAGRDSVNQAIDNLEKLKLIKPIIFFDGVPKYRFNDRELEGLFTAIWNIHTKAEIVLLFKKWSYKEKPTKDEMDRFERLVGKKERQRIEVLCDRIQTQMKLAIKRSETIHQFIKYIEEHTSFFWKLLEYPYETPNTFAEYIAYIQDYKLAPYKKEVPPRLHQIFLEYERFQNLVPNKLICWMRARNERSKEDPFLYSTLESFNRNRAKVQAHTANEVNDFYHYLQYLLDKLLENPGYHDEYIEDIRIQFKDTIMKYFFLEDIIGDVSPKVLYGKNDDHELELIYFVRERINNEMMTHEIREMSEIRKFENRLSSNQIPFSFGEERLYNPVTDRVENRRYFRLLNQDDLCRDKFIIGFHTLELVHDPETQEAKYEPVLHKNDLYQKQNPSKKQIEQFQAKLRSKTTRIVYVVKQKIKGKIKSREIRVESEIHDFEASLKTGTAFHYDIQETFNPSTQEIEYRKIFHLLNQKEIDSSKFSEVHIIEKVYNPMTRRVEDVPVIHFLDGIKNHTTKRKVKKSRNN